MLKQTLLSAASKRSTSAANLKQAEAAMNKRLSSSAALLSSADRSKCGCVGPRALSGRR